MHNEARSHMTKARQTDRRKQETQTNTSAYSSTMS